ncbi:phage tail terminator protein [Rhodococcoides fascians]|uniref:phage tail terminator protein n=1 Tax=Rhodococcoides fascians TaxID=1828 RepID=UPI00056CD862|nr:minor capsid protein [Rhodococcus fascians]
MTATTRSQLRTALALELSENNLARYLAHENYGADDSSRPSVFTRPVMPDSPDTAVTISVIDDKRDRDAHNPDLYVRLRFRAAGRNIRAVDDLADRVFEHLHTFEPTADRQRWPGGVNVQSCFRTATSESATDTTGRYMRADTYRITLNPGD